MPRRRRRKQDAAVGLLIIGVFGILLVLNLVAMFLSALNQHPIAVGIPTVLVIAGAVYGGVIWQQHRRLEARRQWQIKTAQSVEIARYHMMKPRDFERALGFLCERDGCTNVQVIGGRGDLGADVIAIAPDGRKIVLQAKRYGPTTKVGSPELQRFGGTCFTVHNAQVAAVVTTSDFTKQAREYGTHMGIRLFDEQGLAAWASRTGAAPWH